MFYLKEDLVVQDGEVIRGRIGCKPNEKNNRDQDIFIDYEFEGSQHATKVEVHQDFKMR